MYLCALTRCRLIVCFRRITINGTSWKLVNTSGCDRSCVCVCVWVEVRTLHIHLCAIERGIMSIVDHRLPVQMRLILESYRDVPRITNLEET